MEENEKALSEQSPSTEQTDFTPVENINLEAEGSPKKKKRIFTMIVLILSALILGISGYYVYDNYFKGEQVDEEQTGLEPEESTLQYGEISIDIGESGIVYLKIPTSECDDTGFELAESDLKSMKWKDNNNNYCSSWHELEYFIDELTMMEAYSTGTVSSPLERVTLGDIEYGYLSKTDSEDEYGYGMGVLYQLLPLAEVANYKASKILQYYNVGNEDSDFSAESTVSSQLCVLDLNQVNPNINGYVVFSGTASAGSEVDYCEVLNDFGEFTLELQ